MRSYETVMDVIGFEGNVVFDVNKPDGTMRKVLDISALATIGWTAVTDLKSGIKETYQDFLK
jgi:GDP-L-fucose synthase